MKASHIHVIAIFVNKNSIKKKRQNLKIPHPGTLLVQNTLRVVDCAGEVHPSKWAPGTALDLQGSQRPSHQHSVCEQGRGLLASPTERSPECLL